jgi:hypothetical protein
VSSDSITEILSQPEFQEFIACLPNDEHRLHTSKTYQYLKWRYEDIPFFSYQTRWRHHKEACVLLIFRKRMRKGFQELSVSELLLSPNKNAIELAKQVIEDLVTNSDADYVVATAATNTPEYAALRSSKFFPLNSVGPIFVVRRLNDSESVNPLEWAHWRCSLGDLEVF